MTLSPWRSKTVLFSPVTVKNCLAGSNFSFPLKYAFERFSCPLSWWCNPAVSFSVASPSPLPSIFPSIRIFSSESTLCIRWPKHWSFSFSSSPSSEYSLLISFRIDCFDLLAVWETLKSLLQHHSLKASIYWHNGCCHIERIARVISKVTTLGIF